MTVSHIPNYVLVHYINNRMYYYTGYYNILTPKATSELAPEQIVLPFYPMITNIYAEAMKMIFKDEADKLCER